MTTEFRNLNMIAKGIYNNRCAPMQHTTCSIEKGNGMKRIGRKVLILKKLLSSLTCNYYKNEIN
jgi:hypothetical protein